MGFFWGVVSDLGAAERDKQEMVFSVTREGASFKVGRELVGKKGTFTKRLESGVSGKNGASKMGVVNALKGGGKSMSCKRSAVSKALTRQGS